MKKHGFTAILEDCLQRLDRGESLPDLLTAYPDQADELKPLLLVAMASRSIPVPVPSQTAQRLGRNHMLIEMNQREDRNAFRKTAAIPISSRLLGSLVSALRARGFTAPAFSYRLAMISLVLILSGGFFTLNASASSQPGDLLYQLRLGLDRAGLTRSETIREEEQLTQIPPQPWEFGQTVLALEGITTAYQTEEDSLSDSFPNDQSAFLTAGSQEQQADTETKEADREAGKEAAQADRETEKELKTAGKEVEKEAAAAEKEAKQDLKEADKDASKAEKEAEKEAAQAAKETERDLKEADKETTQTSQAAGKPEKDPGQGKKGRAKESKKNTQ